MPKLNLSPSSLGTLFNVKALSIMVFLLASVALIADLQALESGKVLSGKNEGGDSQEQRRLLSELRSVKYEALASDVASILGIDPGRDAESFYLVYLSGRSLRLDPASIGAIGVEPARVGFAAFIPNQGWVALPCRIYDSEIYVNGTVVSLLEGNTIGPTTKVEVKLPTYRPVEASDLTEFPKAFRGAKAFYTVVVEHPRLGTLAVIYAVVGLEYDASYCIQHGGTFRPSGYSAHQQPFLTLKAVKEGLAARNTELQEAVDLLAVAAAFNPLEPAKLGISVTVKAGEPVPNGGGSPQYYTVYDVRGMHPRTAYTQHRQASPESPAVFNVTLIDDSMYGGMAWRRITAFVGFADQQSCFSSDIATVTIAGKKVFEGVVRNGDLVRVAYDAGPQGSYEPWVLVKVSTNSCTWKVNLLPVIVEYIIPQIYASDYVSTEHVKYKLVFLPTGNRPLWLFLPTTSGGPSTAVMAYPLPLFMYGGLSPAHPLRVEALIGYTISGSPAPSAFPLEVKYYLGDRLACTHTIDYSDVASDWRHEELCTFTLGVEDLVNGLYTQWPGIYVTIIAESSGSPGALGLILEVSVESLIESGIDVRRLNPYGLNSGNPIYTSMLPSSSPLWSRLIRFTDYAVTYAIAFQHPESQSYYLGLAYLTLTFNLQRIIVPVCTVDWIASTSDWTLAYAATSKPGFYNIEYRGRLYTFELDDVDLRSIDINIYYESGMALEQYSARYLKGGDMPSNPLPDVPPIVSAIVGNIHPIVSVAVEVYSVVGWLVEVIYSDYYVDSSVSVGDRVVIFHYEAGDRVDLASYPPMPHYGFAFDEGCGVYDMGWSFHAIFEGDWVGGLELSDSGNIARPVTSGG